ncbi:MAG: hypothetical protein J7K83_03060 [Candidatus Aenigmarchaeota archaeon]|nr:hypothetical protein [Candidatus Aenigmarchaeota archaeon]
MGNLEEFVLYVYQDLLERYSSFLPGFSRVSEDDIIEVDIDNSMFDSVNRTYINFSPEEQTRSLYFDDYTNIIFGREIYELVEYDFMLIEKIVLDEITESYLKKQLRGLMLYFPERLNNIYNAFYLSSFGKGVIEHGYIDLASKTLSSIILLNDFERDKKLEKYSITKILNEENKNKTISYLNQLYSIELSKNLYLASKKSKIKTIQGFHEKIDSVIERNNPDILIDYLIKKGRLPEINTYWIRRFKQFIL